MAVGTMAPSQKFRVKYVPLTGREHPITISATIQEKGGKRTHRETLIPHQTQEVHESIYHVLKQKQRRQLKPIGVPDGSELDKRMMIGDAGQTTSITNQKAYFEFLDG